MLELPLPLSDRLRKRTLSVQHTSLSSQRVKCRYGRPLSTWPLKQPWWDLVCWDSAEEGLPTCSELKETKEPPSNLVPKETNVWVDLWHVLPETWTELEEYRRRKHLTYLKWPRMVEGIQSQGSQRLWCFQDVMILASSGIRGYQQINLW